MLGTKIRCHPAISAFAFGCLNLNLLQDERVKQKFVPKPAPKPEASLSPAQRRYFYFTAAVTGAAMMMMEILGARMLDVTPAGKKSRIDSLDFRGMTIQQSIAILTNRDPRITIDLHLTTKGKYVGNTCDPNGTRVELDDE